MEFYEEFMKKYDEELSKIKTEAAKKRQEDGVIILSVKAEKRNYVETLSAKAKTRAGQGISAGILGSVMSDPEKAGTVNTTLEDGGLRKIVAPGIREASEETSQSSEKTSDDETKARILGAKAEGRKETKMSGYNAEQPANILSEKAREHNKEK